MQTQPGGAARRSGQGGQRAKVPGVSAVLSPEPRAAEEGRGRQAGSPVGRAPLRALRDSCPLSRALRIGAGL